MKALALTHLIRVEADDDGLAAVGQLFLWQPLPQDVAELDVGRVVLVVDPPREADGHVGDGLPLGLRASQGCRQRVTQVSEAA